MHQGRKSHGWLGHSTGPAAAAGPAAGHPPTPLAQRIHDFGHTLPAGLPASKRHHDAARLGTEDHARLYRLLAATVQVLTLGGPVIVRRTCGVRPDTPGIDGLVRARRSPAP